MGADYSFEVKNIEIWMPAFFKHNDSSVATVTSLQVELALIVHLQIYERGFEHINISGYIGDKIGFKIVLAVTLFSAGLSATAFDWTPRFNEYHRWVSSTPFGIPFCLPVQF